MKMMTTLQESGGVAMREHKDTQRDTEHKDIEKAMSSQNIIHLLRVFVVFNGGVHDRIMRFIHDGIALVYCASSRLG